MKRKSDLQLIDLYKNLPFYLHIHKRENEVQEARVQKLFIDHWHEEVEINYIAQGQCNYFIDGDLNEVHAGEVIIINSKSVHRAEPVNTKTTKGVMAITLIIDFEFIKKCIKEVENNYFIIRNKNDNEAIRTHLLNLKDAFENGDSENKHLKLISILYDLLFSISDNSIMKPSDMFLISKGTSAQTVRSVMQFIANNYQENITSKDVVSAFNFSREHLTRVFKVYTGITFKEYLLMYRLRQAEKLLSSTDESMTEIAMLCGFSDSRSFINSCKKIYGITPYQFRMRLKNITKQ